MSLYNHLNHRCTVQRAIITTDEYGHDTHEYHDYIIQLLCRLVDKEQRVLITELAEHAVVTVYKMIVPPRTDVQQGDRIIDVVGPHGLVEAGPFRIQSVVKRRGHVERHRTLRLERVT